MQLKRPTFTAVKDCPLSHRREGAAVTSTYLELIDDHHAIEEAAAALLSAANRQAAPALLTDLLHDLAAKVRDHVSAESSALGTDEVNMLTGSWHVTWNDAQGAFKLLCQDWFDYLRGWPQDAIISDPVGFANESEAILSRLGERIRFETEALYTSALQSSRIRLGSALD
jgi:hypothetical protein